MRSESKLSSGEADLEVHKGVRAPRYSVFCFFLGVFELPRESDCRSKNILKGLGSTGCEAAMPVVGGKWAHGESFLRGEADLEERRVLSQL